MDTLYRKFVKRQAVWIISIYVIVGFVWFLTFYLCFIVYRHDFSTIPLMTMSFGSFMGLTSWGLYGLIFQLQKRAKKKNKIIAKLSKENFKMQADLNPRLFDSKRILLNAIPDILFRIQRDGTFVDYMAKKEELYVFPERFIGKTVLEVMPSALALQIMMGIEESIITGTIQELSYEICIADQMQSYEARIVSSFNNEVVAIIRNVTEKKKEEKRLFYMGFHDSMTGLYNRAYFEEAIHHIEKSRAAKVGIMICDLDGLKMINDTLGHMNGDAVIKTVADVLQRSFRKEDLIARVGGDEFAIIIHSDSPLVFEKAGQRIESLVQRYNAWKPIAYVSLSTGYKIHKQGPIDMHALLNEADTQMYKAKKQRQGTIRKQIIFGMVANLEARGIILAKRRERMGQLIVSLAVAAGLAKQNIKNLESLSIFYDIGKVRLSDAVLLKPEKFDQTERELIERHCEIGYNIVSAVPEFEAIALGVLAHHEWVNGGGYPFGLKGKNIPIEARILAIVDAYTAMRLEQPYRQAISSEKAIEELRRCAGKQFDTELVELFIACIQYSMNGT